MAALADSFLADLYELSDNEGDLLEEEDVDAGPMEEDVDGELADIEALNYDDLDSVSKLQKTQRYIDIMQRQTIILDIDEDCQAVETNVGDDIILDIDEDCQAVETNVGDDIISQCAGLRDTKIYYPSCDDPGSVEISYSDVACLDPKCYLTSSIINFYILYLWQKELWLDRGMRDYHFFNTYFYKKLQEAISCTGLDKDASFSKFRRWWKGVNIFHKAYIFIPIHEELHWSLAIICFPDREDQSGPIVLHLDSLQLHRSKLIFHNIKSFLMEEWNHMKLEVDLSELSLAHGIWKILPSRIEEKTISVPQQDNDYDCGLFVLYFMERFIDEAPERHKKKDLSMFGKQWFRPEEASGLRVKIKRLLLEELGKATEANHPSELAAPSSGESD